MPSWRKVTESDKADLFEMFEQGLSTKDIVELTGWKQNTVYTYRKRWKKQKKNEGSAEKIATVTEQEEPAKEEISDYAKAYLNNDPAVIHMVHSSFDIERVVRIKSRKSDILYEVDGCDQKTLKISFPDGQSLNIEIGLFDRFVDEGIDVLLELKRTA